MHAEIIATYRLQLTPDFGFRRAASLVSYLRRLGISHLYLSPILQASPGSDHGYDVADPSAVSHDLGDEQDLHHLFDEVAAAGMGVVVDIVPNHLAAISSNPWWWDVLKKGRSSRHADAFDINWEPSDASMNGRILLPILGHHLAIVIEQGAIRPLRSPDGECELIYEDHRLPLNDEGARLLDSSPPDLIAILECQHYRLCHFSLASEDINYRRFFAVQSLVGLRAEDPQVWEASHEKILELCSSGPVDGLRVDHADGLRDPAEYFRCLRDRLPDMWIVAEKILETGEVMQEWPVAGTTGYDFLQMVGGLWIDPAGEKVLSEFYSDFTGHLEPYGVLVRDKKRNIIRSSFQGDLDRLVRHLRAICDQRLLNYPRKVLTDLMTEVIACFPVYRTYVEPEGGTIPPGAPRQIRSALAAVRRCSLFEESLLWMIESLLISGNPANRDETEFVARFQQLTSPVMAKGVEDTALYCYDRLLALNEVGCDPTRFGFSPEVFHGWNTDAHHRWPRRMLTTSTHDTKRSEDVRALLSVISEIGEEWANQVRAWSAHNLHAWEGRSPDRNAEHLLYQTLAGAWPISVDRVQAYMRKACREASRYTTWESPDVSYEMRISQFVETVLTDKDYIRMLEDFLPAIIPLGRTNSLAQTLLKLTAPGVPDIYQGCEVWDNSLVDPDNRREVDFARRAALLGELETGLSVESIMERIGEGLPKMHVIREALSLRRRRPEAFAPGAEGCYGSLLATGPRLAHLVAFRRGDYIAVIVPRLTAKMGNDWGDTEVELGDGVFTNLLDRSVHEGKVPVRLLFENFPVALLEKV